MFRIQTREPLCQRSNVSMSLVHKWKIQNTYYKHCWSRRVKDFRFYHIGKKLKRLLTILQPLWVLKCLEVVQEGGIIILGLGSRWTYINAASNSKPMTFCFSGLYGVEREHNWWEWEKMTFQRSLVGASSIGLALCHQALPQWASWASYRAW